MTREIRRADDGGGRKLSLSVMGGTEGMRGEGGVKVIEKRIFVYSQVPVENGELIQVLSWGFKLSTCKVLRMKRKTDMFHYRGQHLQKHRYEKNQFYKPHHDYFVDTFNLKRGGQQVATMLMYLSDNVEGGETYFPMVIVAIKD
ncbi:hypothetical protein L1049_027273 [Liquidambar formosana]|uniref:Prolyl 4-hydroxylase alpha subunit Fe(2+) 2OG dioxygenase domain-containing protein n=1 Tax=Liquidambar formosana TaxID=63359 RepID=A0AAP0N7W0_LIQFO